MKNNNNPEIHKDGKGISDINKLGFQYIVLKISIAWNRNIFNIFGIPPINSCLKARNDIVLVFRFMKKKKKNVIGLLNDFTHILR